jgi:hypothetical protein
VAVGVVDRLEPVQVEQDEAGRVDLFPRLGEAGTVQQAGQRVVGGGAAGFGGERFGGAEAGGQFSDLGGVGGDGALDRAGPDAGGVEGARHGLCLLSVGCEAAQPAFSLITTVRRWLLRVNRV